MHQINLHFQISNNFLNLKYLESRFQTKVEVEIEIKKNSIFRNCARSRSKEKVLFQILLEKIPFVFPNTTVFLNKKDIRKVRRSRLKEKKEKVE